MNIGIIGENPYDTTALKNLLSKRYDEKVNFQPALKSIRGTQVISAKTKRLLEMEAKNYKFIIAMIDLDDLETNQSKIDDIYKEIKTLSLSTLIDFFLLNIFELEALILADIENFNKLFSLKINFKTDPMKKVNPKEFLKEKTFKLKRKYSESDNPEVFNNLDIDNVINNCRYFKKFIDDLDKKLKFKK